MPEGVVSVPIQEDSPNSEAKIVRNEVFIAGTEPQATQAPKTSQGILGRLFHPLPQPNLPASAALPPKNIIGQAQGPELPPPPPDTSSAPKRHRVIKKFLSIFKGRSKPDAPDEPKN